MVNTDTYNSLLIHVISQGSLSAAKHYLNKGANPNCTSPRGESALHLSLINKNYRIAKLLIDAGADIHWRDEIGNCALSAALSAATSGFTDQSHAEIISTLESRGAKIPESFRDTMAYQAATDDGLVVMEYLVRNEMVSVNDEIWADGVDVKHPVILWCAEFDSLKCAEYLTDLGADIAVMQTHNEPMYNHLRSIIESKHLKGSVKKDDKNNAALGI